MLTDDTTIIAKDENSLKKVPKTLEEAGRENGLELSEEKRKTLRIRGTIIEWKIGNYKIEKEEKYLGIQIGGKGKKW